MENLKTILCDDIENKAMDDTYVFINFNSWYAANYDMSHVIQSELLKFMTRIKLNVIGKN